MINADKKKEMKNLSEMLLETRNLTKQYGHHKAVDSVNMHIKKGAIYGFIGRNGAGKTTCLKMISDFPSQLVEKSRCSDTRERICKKFDHG